MVKKLPTKEYIHRLLFLCVLLISCNSYAEQREFTYQVYGGGIHAVEARLYFDTNNENYSIILDAKTRGWLSSLVPWSGRFQTLGSLKNEQFLPDKHQSIAVWKGETETKTFIYKDNKIVSLKTEEDGKIEDKNELDQSLTEGTVDVLSATLRVMDKLIKTSKCEDTSDIFDGKRRFAMYFRDRGEKNLYKSKYNIFSGPARLCTVEIEPKGGRWHKKPRGWLSIQEQGRQKGSLPSVWMAKVENFEYAIPVKIMVKTDYGTLLMHLTDVK